MRVKRIRTRGKRKQQAGFTLLEAVLSGSIVAVLLLGAVTAFSSNLMTVEKSKRLTQGALFLGTVLEDIAAQPYSNLLAMNGNQIMDSPNVADSNYSVNLTTFQSGVGIVQVSARLTDLVTNKVLGTTTSIRVDR